MVPTLHFAVRRASADSRLHSRASVQTIPFRFLFRGTATGSSPQPRHLYGEWSQSRLPGQRDGSGRLRSEEHTSELQSLMRISYAVFCLKKKKKHTNLNKLNYANHPQHIQLRI